MAAWKPYQGIHRDGSYIDCIRFLRIPAISYLISCELTAGIKEELSPVLSCLITLSWSFS